MNIINLNKYKKAKAKTKKETTARNNRVNFGRTKAEKTLEKSKQVLDKRKIDKKILELRTIDSDKD